MRRAPHLNHRARTILCTVACAAVLPLTACADDSEGGDGDAPVLTTAEETSAAPLSETSGTQQTQQPQPVSYTHLTLPTKG